MQAAALLQILLALVPVVQTGVPELIAWINSIRATLIATGEWTPEQQTQWRAVLWAKTNDPAYLPDAPTI